LQPTASWINFTKIAQRGKALQINYIHRILELPETMSQLKAVIFGAIGTIAETSDLQRQAFNAAFANAGLDWHWDAATYCELLETNGGQNRLQAYRDADASRAAVTDSTIAKLHQDKTDQYVIMLKNIQLEPRPGVLELMAACKREQIRTAFCTSTTMDNVAAIRDALAHVLPFDQFSTVVTIDKISNPKPAPDAYLYCLKQLGLSAADVVAIEDTPVSIAAAKAINIVTVATPGATTMNQDFYAADLKLADLRGVTVNQLSNLLATKLRATTNIHP
jgi:HAD superfamily hydrolase (TIGR01509 family)